MNSTIAHASPSELNARLAVAKLLRQPVESHHPPEPWIQTIPRFLLDKNPNLSKYHLPEMISFGPIHHNLPLSLGQQLKTTWARRYVEIYIKKYQEQYVNENDPTGPLYNTIRRMIPKLRDLFSDDLPTYEDKKLAEILFVDGCALLYFMGTVDEHHPEKLDLKLHQLTYIWRDAILLENQLPLQLLELLSYDHESQLYNSFYNFLFMGLSRRNREESIFTWSDKRKPAHLLDYIRLFHTSSLSPVVRPSLLDRSIRFFIRLYKKEETLPLRQEDPWLRHKNIRDLRNVGIQVEASNSEWKWNDISFTSKWFSGQLMLPGIVVDDVAPYFYFNMIAFEMLPDFRNDYEFCSYFSLMDSLIDDAEDVKELRLAGVLQNLLGSDEDVAKLFNELGGLLPAKMFNYTTRKSVVAYNSKYIEIKQQIDKHYTNKWKTWRAQLRTTYFNTPWSCIAFLAAALALLLTSIQTWYAIRTS